MSNLYCLYESNESIHLFTKSVSRIEVAIFENYKVQWHMPFIRDVRSRGERFFRCGRPLLETKTFGF